MVNLKEVYFRKIFLVFYMSIIFIILFSTTIYSYTAEEQQVIDEAIRMREQITQECMRDPYSCDCESIPCEDALDVDHPRAGEAYQRCVQERNNCKEKRQAALIEIEETKKRIKEECINDLSRCDCSSVSNAQGIKECEEAIASAREEAEKERAEKIEECEKDIFNCDCSTISNERGREECELLVIEARYEAEKERAEKIEECKRDLDGCDCSTISDEEGRKECETKIKEAKELRQRIEDSCRTNPLVCDCSLIESSSGREECEREKENALEEATNQIRAALSRCFRNVDECVCRELGISDEDYVEFCEVQKNYGLSCKYEGDYCEKLENSEIYPPGMPPWLGTIFAREYSFYIEREKENAAKEAAKIITNCINNPETCECDKTPSYAVSFCERMRDLQIMCYQDNYEACMILEKSPNLPEKFPPFAYSGIDRMIQELREAREKTTKSSASRRVGNMILECMTDSSKCDCSMAPRGDMSAFCEHKKQLVLECVDEKKYSSCFTLHEEPLYSESMPDFIIDYIQKNVQPKVEEKKIEMFNNMKEGTLCHDIDSLEECKVVFESILE